MVNTEKKRSTKWSIKRAGLRYIRTSISA